MPRGKTLIRGVITGVLLSAIFMAGFFVLTDTTQAVDTGTEIGGEIGYSDSNLLDITLNVVRWALGLLALVAVIFIIYGGYLWMSSRGNEETVTKAKRVIRDAVIGLVIVLLAWAIVTYVIGVIGNASNGGTSGCTQHYMCIGCHKYCDADGNIITDLTCTDLCTTLPGSDFIVTSTDPRHGANNVTLCTVIQAWFNDDVNTATVDSGTFILRDESGTEVEGDYDVADNLIDFDPTDDLVMNTHYFLDIIGVFDDDGTEVEPKTIEFWTGEEEDTTPPTVTLTSPAHNQVDVCTNANVGVTFNEPMRMITVHDGIDDDNPSISLTNTDLGVEVYYNPRIRYVDSVSFSARPNILPLDSNSQHRAYLRGGNDPYAITDVCGNPLDGEGGPVAGGTPDGIIDPPGEDKYEWDFKTGENPDCTPVINDIDPSQGYYTETVVTITGYYFDYWFGDIIFKNRIYDKANCFDTYNYPSQDCISSWLDTEIKVKVPAGAEDNGPVKVDALNGSATSEETFLVQSPFIDWVSPNSGGPGQYLTVRGDNFGDDKGTVWFRKWTGIDSIDVAGVFPPEAECGNTWTDNQIIIKVPASADFTAGDYLRIQVQRAPPDERWSNQHDFTFTDDPPGPGLCKVEPECGSAGESVDLVGENFGSQGADDVVNFSEFQGASYSNWENSYISVASQDSLVNDRYTLRVFKGEAYSNPWLYNIPCGDAPYIVNDSTCDLSDHDNYIWPSPNPRANANDVCTNALVAARFGPDGITMEVGTLAPNIELQKCNVDIGDGFSVIDCSETVSTSFEYFPANTSFTLTPDGPLTANTWYQAIVHKEVESFGDGARMNNDYKWHFRINEGGEVCELV
ncbi:Ig-like domain-containing protein, partial [Patescibacteria group bacterium]|nr:Ig-like domain-containing protein [Patescibacteria group bacterium]